MEVREIAGTMEVKDGESRACEDVGEEGGIKISLCSSQAPYHRDMETRGSLWNHGPFAHLVKTWAFSLDKCANVHFAYNFRDFRDKGLGGRLILKCM